MLNISNSRGFTQSIIKKLKCMIANIREVRCEKYANYFLLKENRIKMNDPKIDSLIDSCFNKRFLLQISSTSEQFFLRRNYFI